MFLDFEYVIEIKCSISEYAVRIGYSMEFKLMKNRSIDKPYTKHVMVKKKK